MQSIIDSNKFVVSPSIIDKAIRLITNKKVSLVSEIANVRKIHFHICPEYEDGTKVGFATSYHIELNDWSCTCRFEIFRADSNKVCSHILASAFLLNGIKTENELEKEVKL